MRQNAHYGRLWAWLAIIAVLATTAYSMVSENVVYSFEGGADGRVAWSGLVADTSGNLFGTTAQGGGGGDGCSLDGAVVGCGAVYSLTPNGSGGWNERVILDLSSLDVRNAVGGLVRDSGGNFYGTATELGTGGGGAFELSPSNGGWTAMLLSEEVNSNSAMLVDSEGDLWGVSYYGSYAFELAESNGKWNRTTLAQFNGANGEYPYGSLVFASSGVLIGTTVQGGANNYGTVFELQESNGNWSEQVLYNFTGGADGGFPYSGVTVDASGNLYGTTAGGGAENFGTVYELSSSNGEWVETVLHNFLQSDGAGPVSPLISDARGDLFGTTVSGGKNNLGTVYGLKRTASGWTEVVLHSFAGNDGAYPYGGLLLNAGKLYGTTSIGGSSGYGTVFVVEK